MAPNHKSNANPVSMIFKNFNNSDCFGGGVNAFGPFFFNNSAAFTAVCPCKNVNNLFSEIMLLLVGKKSHAIKNIWKNNITQQLDFIKIEIYKNKSNINRNKHDKDDVKVTTLKLASTAAKFTETTEYCTQQLIRITEES